jgi:hypothetical protein
MSWLLAGTAVQHDGKSGWLVPVRVLVQRSLQANKVLIIEKDEKVNKEFLQARRSGG